MNFQYHSGTSKIYTIIFCGNGPLYGYSYWSSIYNKIGDIIANMKSTP
jgi:hypothetical protein